MTGRDVVQRVRRHGHLAVDLALQTLLMGLFLVSGVLAPGAGQPSPALTVVLAAAQIGPLALRRRAPVTVLVVVASAAGWHVLAGMPRTVGYLPALLALHTAAGHPRAVVRWGLCGVVSVALAATSLPRYGVTQGGLLALVVVAVAWLSGVERGNQARQRAALAAEATRLRLERRLAREERAAARDRERLARHLHDTLAHSLTVMVVQTEALRVTGDLDPAGRDRVERVLGAGRSALTEIRHAVAALEHPARPRAPADLAARLRDLGEAGLRIDGTPPQALADLPEPLRAVAYRLVAEAATNALRHDGPGTRVTVDVDRDGPRIRLSVRSDRPAVAGPAPRTASAGPGYGLRSLAADVAARGGDLRWGPVAPGRWQVTATVPASAAGQPVTAGGGRCPGRGR
ncbi:sensor histidine kinase [Micromonospora fluostatini]|uniref:sensor histidine kinase n=1 Tax=Micromonospora sp. JCM 30529 TaxID=3421643 RepID=UPI003D16913C